MATDSQRMLQDLKDVTAEVIRRGGRKGFNGAEQTQMDAALDILKDWREEQRRKREQARR